MEFFNKADIDFFTGIADQEYDYKNKQHLEWVNTLKKGIYQKLDYWLDQMLLKAEGFEGKVHRTWHKRAGPGVLKFRDYAWGTIYKKDDRDKYIYFTIEVSVDEQALAYKLDYKFLGDDLSPVQKDLCETMKEPAPRISIDSDELGNYNWDKLTNETVSYINKFSSLYDDMVKAVWSNNEKRVCRIVWNEREGWLRPSGPYGKSKNPKSHEFQTGFGHEEWLFDIGKLINGSHYGFLEPIEKHRETYADKNFDVWLYTIDGVSGKRFWIGEIKNVTVLNNQDAIEAQEYYRKKGWLNEMVTQLDAVDADSINIQIYMIFYAMMI